MRINIYTNKFLKLFTRVIAILMLVSCADEHEPNLKPDKSKEALVTFTLQLPGKNSVATRAETEKNENEVAEITILVFKPNGGEYVYTARCSGSDITTDTGNSRLKTFTVKLKQGAFDIVILANAHSVIQSASLDGLTKDDALAGLKMTMPANGKWPVDNFKPFPMWGNVGNITITESIDLTGDNRINLTRMVARVDVQITGQAINSFKLTSVDVYNYHAEGLIVKTGEPSLPAASVPVEEPITYNETAINTIDNLCAGKIYLFEAENHSDAEHTRPKPLANRTCLVIGGVWDATGTGNFAGETTYYRVDFSEKSDMSQRYLDVLRNRHYVFDITRISGYGHDDSNTAFLSEPVNIEAEVLEWDDAELGEVVFNGQNYLSVTPGVFGFSADKRQPGITYEDNILYVKTDYNATGNNSKPGWYVERIVAADDETTEVNWLTLTPREGSPDVKTGVTLTFDENNEPEARSAIVFIAAGRLHYKVQVTQSNASEAGLRIYDPLSGNPLDVLWFYAEVGVEPEEKRIRVDWIPITSSLFVTNNQISENEFPSGGTTGTPVTQIINNGVGTVEYLIKLPAVYPDDLDPSKGGNPFLSRASTINFSLSSETSFVSKSILLRQIHYNLLAEYNESGYVLNGAEYEIPVKCNSNWMVSDITGDTEILANEAEIRKQTGGYNVTTGTPLKIKAISMSPDGSNSGKTAYIHLKEVDDKCPPVTIAFKGIECGMNGNAIAINIGVNGYNNTNDGTNTYLVHMYGKKCWMVQNLREGDPAVKQYQTSPRPPEGERGYYYNYSEITRIGCPPGWRLPEKAEIEELLNEIPSSSGEYWWESPENLAGFGNVLGTWTGWGSRNRWLSAAPEVVFTANYSSLTGVTTLRILTNADSSDSTLSSVRCVREQ